MTWSDVTINDEGKIQGTWKLAEGDLNINGQFLEETELWSFSV